MFCQQTCQNVAMENNWKAETAARIGRAVKSARHGRFTAEQLAKRCGELGHPIHRTTITKIEGGRGSFEVADLLILAAALEVPPILLLYPDIPDGPVDVIPGFPIPSDHAVDWFTGDGGSIFVSHWIDGVIEPLPVDHSARELLDAVRTMRRVERARNDLITQPLTDDDRPLLDVYEAQIAQLRQRISQLGGVLRGDD